VDSDVLKHPSGTAFLQVATIDSAVRLELGEKVVLLATLTDLDVSLGEVAEEELFVLGVGLNPSLERSVLDELKIGITLEVH